jgi:hypothetical protein
VVLDRSSERNFGKKKLVSNPRAISTVARMNARSMPIDRLTDRGRDLVRERGWEFPNASVNPWF